MLYEVITAPGYQLKAVQGPRGHDIGLQPFSAKALYLSYYGIAEPSLRKPALELIRNVITSYSIHYTKLYEWRTENSTPIRTTHRDRVFDLVGATGDAILAAVSDGNNLEIRNVTSDERIERFWCAWRIRPA